MFRSIILAQISYFVLVRLRRPQAWSLRSELSTPSAAEQQESAAANLTQSHDDDESSETGDAGSVEPSSSSAKRRGGTAVRRSTRRGTGANTARRARGAKHAH